MMSEAIQYIAVTDGDLDDAIEVPMETDGHLLLSTLAAQYPGASGLKYKPADAKVPRGLRCDDGKIFAPADGWGDFVYTVVFPKEPNAKRKIEEALHEGNDLDAGIGGGRGGSASAKHKRVDRNRKCSDLIVLGLPFTTTSEDLKEYFEQFGTLIVAEVKMHSKDGKSKGFGFVRFAEYESQLKALGRRHQIADRWCDCKIPNSQLGGANPQSSQRIFVGRVPEEMTSETLKTSFEEYGEVVDVYLPRPNRGFAFVTFKDPDVAERLINEELTVDGHSLHIGPAAPKAPNQPSGQQQQHHGGSQQRSDGPPVGSQGIWSEQWYSGQNSGPNFGVGPSGMAGMGGGGHPQQQQQPPQFYQSKGQHMGGGGPLPHHGGGGGNNLTQGIDQLNLGAAASMNPTLLAAAHAAILNALTGVGGGNSNGNPAGGSGGSDYNSLYNTLQQASGVAGNPSPGGLGGKPGGSSGPVMKGGNPPVRSGPYYTGGRTGSGYTSQTKNEGGSSDGYYGTGSGSTGYAGYSGGQYEGSTQYGNQGGNSYWQ